MSEPSRGGFEALELEGLDFVLTDEADRLHVPQELHAFLPGVLVFEVEGGHLLGAAAIDHRDGFCAEPDGGVGSVDRGVARADDGDVAGDLRDCAALVIRDERERVGHPGELFAGDAEAMDGAEAYAEEDRVVLGFEAVEHGGVNDGVEVELDAELGDAVDLAQAGGGGELVLGDAVGIEAAGQRARVVEDGADALAAELGGTGERCGTGPDECDGAAGVGRGCEWEASAGFGE